MHQVVEPQPLEGPLFGGPFFGRLSQNGDSFVGAGTLLIVANIIFILSVDKHAISDP